MKTGQDKDADSMGMLSLQNEGQIPLTPPLEKGVDDPINNFAFVGRYGGFRDWDTGLTQFLHRWYDSRDGRWLSRDPIGVEGGVNLYNYTDNNPVNRVDVTGLCPLGAPTPTPPPTYVWTLKNSFLRYYRVSLSGEYFCFWQNQYGGRKMTRVQVSILLLQPVSSDLSSLVCEKEGRPR